MPRWSWLVVAGVVVAGGVTAGILVADGDDATDDAVREATDDGHHPPVAVVDSVCELVTDAEIEEIAGSPPLHREEGPDAFGLHDLCTWSTDAGTVALSVVSDHDWDGAREAARHGIAATTDPELLELAYEEIEGIGDEAFVQHFNVEATTLQTTLHVRADGRHFMFTVTFDPRALFEVAPRIVERD